MTDHVAPERTDDFPQDASDLVAIIGMNGRFPGADNVQRLWENLRDGKESITFFSDEQLSDAGIDEKLLRNPSYVKARGVVQGIKMFDASFFGLSPREAAFTDPQQRLFLECAWELLEEAGYDLDGYNGSVGLFAGSAISTYLLTHLWLNPELADSVDPYLLVLANDKDHLTTRVAYKLNLKGPCVTVQTGCSTSLVAVHLACQSLLSRECDMALAGGAALNVPQATGYLYQEGNKSSPDGHTRTFDTRARGTVQSEGVAITLLKRLEDALRDGDDIHAVIRASAINNDGSAKVSYTAPSVDGQAQVIRTAQLLSGVPADTIEYVECHGTATEMGDPIEVAALAKVFRASTEREQFCALGALKSNVGHMDSASGVGGLIKAALALRHACIPPTLHYENPNPQIDFARSPFFVNTTPRVWTRSAHPRRAAVSAFGVGGTNVHVVLEESPARVASDPAHPWQLLLLSAKTETALQAATKNLSSHLQRHRDLNLADVAHTLQTGRKVFEHRRFVVARDTDDAIAALETMRSDRVFTRHTERERAVVMLLPGQGSQYDGMGRELSQREPIFRRAIDECTAALGASLDSTTSLFAFEYALARLWHAWGVRPHAYLGHSMGEYVAATLAGVMALPDALRIVAARDRLIRSLPEGGILTVLLGEGEALPPLGDDVAVTAVNGPSILSLSGSIDAIDALAAELERRQIVHNRLPVSHVSHCRVVDPILDSFRRVLDGVELRAPDVPCMSNVTGEWLTAEQATDPEYWVRHLREPVQFSRGVSALVEQSEWIFLEVAPGRTLASLIHQHDRSNRQVVIPSLPQPSTQGEAELVLQAVGKLWAAGGRIERGALHGTERRLRVPLPTYPFERQRCWIDPPRRSGWQQAPSSAARAQETVAQPEPSSAAVPTSGAHAATPATEPQKTIMRFWQELLGVPHIGLHDSFFDLGGNSLLGIQLHTRVKEEFDVDISLKDLLERSTLAGMAELVELIILEEIEAIEA